MFHNKVILLGTRPQSACKDPPANLLATAVGPGGVIMIDKPGRPGKLHHLNKQVFFLYICGSSGTLHSVNINISTYSDFYIFATNSVISA